ncbi:conserved hypothetical protein [Burkholderia latens]|uniref:hypothetical protein n=1 Tax=Burkholderia latens TaxID=488446 RepID=UPI0039A4F97C
MNCKPGDMAIIVNDGGSGALGYVVEVIQAAPPREEGPLWEIQFRADQPIYFRDTGERIKGTRIWILDAWLRPVSGLHVTDDVEDEVTA